MCVVACKPMFFMVSAAHPIKFFRDNRNGNLKKTDQSFRFSMGFMFYFAFNKPWIQLIVLNWF